MTTLSSSAALFDLTAATPIERPARSGRLGFVSRLRDAFAGSAQARAREQMLGYAARCEASQPQLAGELRAACAAMPSH